MSKLIVAEPKPGIFTCVVLVPFLGEYDTSLLARCSVDIRRKMTDVVYQRKVMRDRISVFGPKVKGTENKRRLQYILVWGKKDEDCWEEGQECQQ